MIRRTGSGRGLGGGHAGGRRRVRRVVAAGRDGRVAVLPSAETHCTAASVNRKLAALTHGTCHQLRHTCLTRLREAGMALEAVQAQAGHRSIESTRVYLHLTNDWLAREYRRASDLIEAGHAAELIAIQELAR